MVEIPLDRLLQIGYDDLHKNQAELKRVAALIDASKTPEQILAALEQDHPKPDQLLQTFRDTFNSLIGFIQQKHIITIPSDIRPIVEETPPFARALTFASMDTPGPYETKATEAYFNVTLPEPSWTAEKIRSWMEGFSRGTIISTAVHEAYPGHYEQFLWEPQYPSKVRKLTGCGTNIEGWAHYTEQMMLDEGYGNGDPKLRIGQLQDALLRDARYIVGIEMHTGKMTLATGDRLLRQAGTPDLGRRRARGAARHLRSDVSGVHAGQAGDSQTARRLQEEGRREFHSATVSRRVHEAGCSADSDRSARHAGERQSGAVNTG